MGSDNIADRQRQIREGQARRIHYRQDWACDWEDASEDERTRCLVIADEDLAFLSEQGCVFKVDESTVSMSDGRDYYPVALLQEAR